MRKFLFIIGIICVVACAFSLVIAGLSMFGYFNLLDGSPELYSMLLRRMIIFFIVGGVLAVVGTVCFVVRSKI